MAWFTAFVYSVGSLVCHQIPARSFYYAGAQFPVCARCTGLYLGALAGLVVWTAGRQRWWSYATGRHAILLASLPTLVTVTTATLGGWDPGNTWRALFALPLGLTIAYVLATGLTGHLR